MLKDTHYLFYCSHCGTEATRAERVGLALDHASYDLINCAGDETPAGVIEIAHLLIAFARVDEARDELSLCSIDATALAHEARLITSPGARQDRHVLRQIRYGQTVIAILLAAQRIASRRLARHIALDDIVIALLQSENGDPGVVLMQRYARRSGPAEISQLPEPYYSSMVREQPTASQRWQRAHPDDIESQHGYAARTGVIDTRQSDVITALSRQIQDLQSETRQLRLERTARERDRQSQNSSYQQLASHLQAPHPDPAPEPVEPAASQVLERKRLVSRLAASTALFELPPPIDLTAVSQAAATKQGRAASSSRRTRTKDVARYAAFAAPTDGVEDDDEPDADRTREKRFYLALDDDIVDAPSIGHRTAERLRAAGIHTVRELLKAEPEALALQLRARNISSAVISAWQHQARLVVTVPWLRGTHAQLLVGAGHPSHDVISSTDQNTLLAAVLRFTATREGQSVLRAGPPPDAAKIASWIAYAQQAETQRAKLPPASEAP